MPKDSRQPKNCPIIRPSGKPNTIANALPIANSPMACAFLSFGATRTAKDVVIDQKIA